jgi:3-dehydroquinate synthase
LGPQSYDIVLGYGVLARLPDVLATHCPAHSYAIISDSVVAPLYIESVVDLVARVAPAKAYAFAAGEWNKTRESWESLSDQLLADQHGRDCAIVALGGGVVGDLAGFVAATFRRGVPYVQVPTSLLAMIDSSIGGKTGVDTLLGKNLIGAFHQPKAVIADIRTLSTLSPIQLAAGMAEALKHGAIRDATYFETMVAQKDAIRSLDTDTLIATVRRSMEIKAAIVAEDERERGRRAILNFGHTIGHALEATHGYELLHGEAVAIGMLAEAKLGVLEGVTEPSTVDRLRDALMEFSLPVSAQSNVTPHDIQQSLLQDKKNRAGTVRFALLERLGTMASSGPDAWTRTASDENISNVIAAIVSR